MTSYNKSCDKSCNGSCIKQTDDFEEYKLTGSCKLFPCKNAPHCTRKCPEWLLDCHFQMCPNCAICMGRINETEIMDDCPVCLETKLMIKLKCNHLICQNCWFNITVVPWINYYEEEHDDEENAEKTAESNKCPLCRGKTNWAK